MFLLEEISNPNNLEHFRQLQRYNREMKFEMIFSFILLVIFVLFILYLFRRHDKKTGIKGSGFASFMTKLTILVLLFTIYSIWFSKAQFDMGMQIVALGLPIGAIYFSDSEGLISGLTMILGGIIIGALIWVGIQILGMFGITHIDLIIKIVGTIINIIGIRYVHGIAFEGWTSARTSYSSSSNSYYSPSYSSSSYSSSSSNDDFDLFGKDFREEVDPFTGDVKYYSGYTQIGYGRKTFTGDTEIFDMNGNKQLTKKQDYLFGEATYEDNNYNTKYRQKSDFLGGSYVEDNKYNTVATHDPWDDIFSTGKNYKSKK